MYTTFIHSNIIYSELISPQNPPLVLHFIIKLPLGLNLAVTLATIHHVTSLTKLVTWLNLSRDNNHFYQHRDCCCTCTCVCMVMMTASPIQTLLTFSRMYIYLDMSRSYLHLTSRDLITRALHVMWCIRTMSYIYFNITYPFLAVVKSKNCIT